MASSPCPKCARLALRHDETIRQHTEIAWPHIQATDRQDHTAIASIGPILKRAREERRLAREALITHRELHHEDEYEVERPARSTGALSE